MLGVQVTYLFNQYMCLATLQFDFIGPYPSSIIPDYSVYIYLSEIAEGNYISGSGSDVGSDANSIDSNVSPNGDLVNVDNGLKLDRTCDIVEYCQDRRGVDEYFTKKEDSIRESFRTDSNEAAASGTSVSELQHWLSAKNDLLDDLSSQKIDVLDLGNYEDSDSDAQITTKQNTTHNFVVFNVFLYHIYLYKQI